MSIVTKALAALLLLAASACLWLYVDLLREESAHAKTSKDLISEKAKVESLATANQAQKDAIATLKGKAELYDRLASYSSKFLDSLSAADTDAAISIQGAVNDRPDVDIDKPLPLSLTDPVVGLSEQVAARSVDRARASVGRSQTQARVVQAEANATGSGQKGPAHDDQAADAVVAGSR